MKNTKNLIIATLAVIVIIDEAIVIPVNHRIAKREKAKLTEMTEYLASLLDKNGVELSEFDKLALMSIAK